MTVTPELEPSREDMTPSIVRVQGSSKIVLQNVLVIGEARVYTCPGNPDDICPEAGAWVEIAGDSANVAIKSSEIANCRRTCVQTGGTGLTITDNTFHDSLGGHFIGTIASGVTIRGNRFDRALDPDCAGLACPRGPQGGQHIRISGGAPWTIERNRFGLNQDAASVRVEPIANPTPVRDVLIASNIFDAMAQGLSGIEIVAAAREQFVPVNSKVVNNTIITRSSAVKLGDGWEKWDAAKRPIIANNIFKSIASVFCGRGKFSDNLSMGSEACPGDEIGQANLDAQFRPTASSLLVIDQADPLFAPARDYFGRARVGAPDRGAIEYRP